ncbi:MAG: hypothetical protein WAN86_00815 [Hyphomicrobiaceae bacterium]
MPQAAVPRLVSAPFFSAHPVFTRAEYAAAVGRRRGDKVVSTMLDQHLRAGNIRRISRGVFASVPKHADARKWVVDRFLAASRLRSDAVIAYHAALELHGCTYTEGHEVQAIARGDPRLFAVIGFTCRFVRPPQGFTPPDGIIKIDRLGQHVPVTTIERTIVDLFDRYDLAGGAEELFNSLDLVARVDAAALVRYAHALGNASAAGALGFWLQRNQKRLGVPDRALDQLHKLAPTESRYVLGAKPGEGKTAKGWNVILPRDVAERRYEGL